MVKLNNELLCAELQRLSLCGCRRLALHGMPSSPDLRWYTQCGPKYGQDSDWSDPTTRSKKEYEHSTKPMLTASDSQKQ